MPERPPKKPHLRAAFPPPVPERLPSPDLPPPSPPTVLEDEVFASDEPLPPPPPELHSPDKVISSEFHGERTSLLQKQLSQNISSVQRHQDTTIQRHLKSSSGRSPENDGAIHSESVAQRHVENSASSPQRSPGSTIQQCPESMPSPQSPSETNVPRISVACNAPSMRHVEDSVQRDCSASVQQKYHKNRSSPDSNHSTHRQTDNAMSSQRYPERGFSLSRHSEDCVVPQKHLDSISTSQRHIEHSSAAQRHRECAAIQKHVVNISPVHRPVCNERNQQNGLSQRHMEDGSSSQKQAENGSVTPRLMDSVNQVQRSIDTNVSMSRHVSSSAHCRRQECGAVSNSSSHQGYIVTSPAYRNTSDSFARTSAIKPLESDTCTSAGLPLSRHADNNRSSVRYPTQKLVVNGKLATPVSEQMKQREGSVDLVRTADRAGLRNGEVLLPSKTCLQSLSTAVSSEEGNAREEPPRTWRSPPHVKQESNLTGRQHQTEEPGVSAAPHAASSEGTTSDMQHFVKTEQNSLEPPAAVTRLAMNSHP